VVGIGRTRVEFVFITYDLLTVFEDNHGSTFSRLIVNDRSISIIARVFSNNKDGPVPEDTVMLYAETRNKK
jgi:hypothetical protein